MYVKQPKRQNPPIKRSGSDGFPEGLNTLAHPSTIKDTELSELLNGIYSQYGTISKRQGTKAIGSPSDGGTEILNLGETYSIGGEDYFIRISDTGIPEYYDFSAKIWDDLSATAPDGYSGSTPTFTTGVPTFDVTSTTWIVQANSKVYFANEVDDLVWLDEDGWHINTELDDPTAYPTIAKTGSGTGSTPYYYYYAWYNDAGGTEASPAADPDVQASGTGWIQNMPQLLDEDTYLTITLPAAPAACTSVGIFKSNRQGEGFFLDSVDPKTTTYADKGDLGTDTFYEFPEDNTTIGYHFSLLDFYGGGLIGVTTELGNDVLAWDGGLDKIGNFGLPDGGGYVPYRQGDGTQIRAIKDHVASNENSLFVFKDKVFGKFQFTVGADGIAEGTITDVNIAVGSISRFSPHTAGNNLRFWSRDGASTIGNEANYGTILRYSVLSLRANSIVQQITATNIDDVCGIFYKSLSLFGISTTASGEGNNAILAYDERYNSWAMWTGVYPKVFAKYISPVDNIERLYYGSAITADVLEMFTGKKDYAGDTTYETKITLSISTKQYDMKLPDQFKKFDKCTLVFGSLTGNNTTVGVIKAGNKGIESDPRLLITQEATLSGFGNDEWGDQEVGMMTQDDAGSTVNLRYINLKQKDLFWVKLNIQNDGVEDEISLIGVYIYYSQSTRPLTFGMKLRELAV